MFLLPGKEFTGGFVESWNLVKQWLVQNKVQHWVKHEYSSDLYWCRNRCLTDPSTPQKLSSVPWAGEIDYTHMIWIDSDQVFDPEHIEKLLLDDVDIVSAVIPIGPSNYPCFGWYVDGPTTDGKKLHQQKISLSRLEDADQDKNGLVEVDFTGFGLLCVKKGVFETMEYPWFQTLMDKYDVNGMVYEMSEDVAWCWRVQELGWKIHVDLKVVIGHQKTVTLTRQDAFKWAEEWLNKQKKNA